MALLVFQASGERYALELGQVERILPSLILRRVPHAPPWVAGLLEYRGRSLPVVELGLLFSSKPCRDRMSSRLILVRYPAPPGYPPLLGLLAEEVTTIRETAGGGFRPTGLEVAEAPFLGGVMATGRGLVQQVVVEALLPDAVRESLFPPLELAEERP